MAILPTTGILSQSVTIVDQGVVLSASALNGTATGSNMAAAAGGGVKLFINITTLTGTSPTLTVTLQGQDVSSGAFYTILASTALNATGLTVLTVYPGATAATNSVANDFLPHIWRVIAVTGGTTPAATFTVSATTIQ